MIKIESKESDKEVIEYKEFGAAVDVRAGKVYLEGCRLSLEGARELSKDLLRAVVYAESAPKPKSRSRKVGLYRRLRDGDMAAAYLQVASEDSKEGFKKALRKAVEHVYEALLTEGDQK